MSRTHPPSLLRQVRATLTSECEVKGGSAIGVAVSGGPDSMALLHALSLLRDELDLDVIALSIDHGLREEAPAEVQTVERFCQQHELKFFSTKLALEDGSNLQARAREARYGALWELVHKHVGPEAFLATAHQKEDRAETILMRILRGTSLSGLAVLPPQTERLLRPMIRASRADVLSHIERHGVPTCLDPSNQDPRFLRVQTRHQLIPLLTKMGPGVVDHLVDLADEAMQLPEPLGLNREQRRQIRAALRDPSLGVNLRLPGGLSLTRNLGSREPKR